MAWLVTRTDMPGKALVRTLTIAAFVTLLPRRHRLRHPGGAERRTLQRPLPGRHGGGGALVNIFSMPGLIYVTSLYTFPVVFILTSAALSVTPADLEEAARIAGAGRLAVMRTITLPLALPAIVGGFILAFLEALVLFGAPAMLAIPARFHVMTTQIWAFFHYPPQIEVAAACVHALLLVAVVLLWVQRRLMGRRDATVGGRAVAARSRSVAGGGPLGACGESAASIGLPYFALLRAALAKAGASGGRGRTSPCATSATSSSSSSRRARPS